MTTATAPRLKSRYKSDVAAHLQQQFGYKNRMQIPTLTKVVVNMGVGEAAKVNQSLISNSVKVNQSVRT
jgi:large subunit ribosomal protein L5